MNRRTFVILGLTLLSLGAGAMALGLVEEESRVRQVGEVVAEPGAYAEGAWTIVGMAQPATVPTINGTVANPTHRNETLHVRMWEDEGPVQASYRLHFDGAFTFTNTTRVPGGDVLSETTATWTPQGHVFPIQGFAMDVPEEWIWAVYDGVLKEPLQPKPSQFTGRLATHMPDGTPLPDGAYVLLVDEITIGCSSKFLPEEHQETS